MDQPGTGSTPTRAENSFRPFYTPDASDSTTNQAMAVEVTGHMELECWTVALKT